MSEETKPPVQSTAATPATTPAVAPTTGQQVNGQTIALEDHNKRVSGLSKRLNDALGQANELQTQNAALQSQLDALTAQNSTLQTTISERETALSTAQQTAQEAKTQAHLLGLAAANNPKLLPLLANGTISAPIGEDDEAIIAGLKELEGSIQSVFGSGVQEPPAPDLPIAPTQPVTQPAGSPALSTSMEVDIAALRAEHLKLSGDFESDPATVERRMMEIEAVLNTHNATGAQ